MKTKKKILGLIACIVFVTFISSCKKEKETSTAPTGTSVSQDKTNMNSSITAAGDEAVSLLNTEGSKALSSLTNVMDKSPAFGKKAAMSIEIGSKVRTAVYGVRNVVHWKKRGYAKTTSSDNFDFSASTGTYTWDNSMQDWTKDLGNPNDKIILLFPTDSTNASVNNGKLTINNYSEQLITDPNTLDSTYVPTRLVADLYVDNIEYANVDYTGTFNSDGVPVAVNLNLYVKPYTLALVFNNQQTTVTINLQITKDGAPSAILAINGTITFVDASQQELKTVAGSITFEDLGLSGNVNVQALNALDSATTAQLNDNIHLAILYQGAKIGDLLFITGDIDQSVAVIKFKDGSTQPAEDYFQPLINRINDEFAGIGFGKK